MERNKKSTFAQKFKPMNSNKLKLVLGSLIMLIMTSLSAQSFEAATVSKKSELNVLYFENEPYAYKDAKGNLVGIEVEIMNSFVNWLKAEKGIQLKLNYIPSGKFNEFYNNIKNAAGNTIGLGSVTMTDERSKEVNFSAPYLKNIAVLVTDGSVPTARDMETLKNEVLSLTPVTIRGSIHQLHLDELYKSQKLESKTYVYLDDAIEIPAKVKESSKYFGYVDIISFWKYVKNNPEQYIKMQSIVSKKDEYFGFIMPRSTDWKIVIDEFFESGFGFTSTKEYHEILERHLSFEIIGKVELD